jgi:hypothetical protein
MKLNFVCRSQNQFIESVNFNLKNNAGFKKNIFTNVNQSGSFSKTIQLGELPTTSTTYFLDYLIKVNYEGAEIKMEGTYYIYTNK